MDFLHRIYILVACNDAMSLDNCNICGINTLTFLLLRSPGAISGGETRQQALKDRSAPRRGHAEPNAAEGAPSKVSAKRALPSPRTPPRHLTPPPPPPPR